MAIPMHDFLCRCIAVAGVSIVFTSPARALDANTPAPATATLPIPVDKFKTTRDAFRTGIKEYNAGHKAGAVKALEFAASQGHALARWKLGKMYADGDGVQQNDLKAFENFSRIADEHADENPDSSNSRFVSSAFVALGSYYLDGIPGTYVKPNGQRAREMFQYAASYFGDPDAQYNLARLFLDGVGGGKDLRQAMRWLNLAAEKQHAPSQALLGHMLFTGEGGMRQKARGLMWLTIARDAADTARDAWILELHDQAFAQAADTDRQAALAFLEQQIRKRP